MTREEIQAVIDKGGVLKEKAGFLNRLIFGMSWYLLYPIAINKKIEGNLRLKNGYWIARYCTRIGRIIGEATPEEINKYTK